ncbi:cyclic di-GMP phosphodiesterase Gmr [bacterium BMS3Bbin09]|nr:cyclic di-GMP phosphodiesterase Gmr [bacterium BMS3Bbin09]
MKRKIVISLFALFLFFTLGAIIASIYIKDNNAKLERIIKLHEVEQLRRTLLINLQTVQSDLYTVKTPFETNLNAIVKNAANLEDAASKCSSCHHPPNLDKKILNVQSLIKDYENALSYYITVSANPVRMAELKSNAAKTGEKLITLTKNMSHNASQSIEQLTTYASIKINHAKTALVITLVVTFVLGIIVAIILTKSVTKPVKELVNATRMISSGKFGTTISFKDKTEFGELASHFNKMSTAIKEGYEKIQQETKERWQAEEAVIKSGKFLHTIFDSIRDPFCIIDNNYKIVRVNEAYAELKKKEINELVGKKCYEATRGKSRICDECIVKATFLSADPAERANLITYDDGTRIWLEIHTYPIFDEEGNVSHIIEYIRDITDRKLSDEAMRESEERYMLAARGANDGLWDWNMKSNDIYYSSRWKSMLGFKEGEIKNNPAEWLDRIHPDDRMHVETEIAAHINGHTPNLQSEHRIMHKNGTYRWVLVRGLAVRDAILNIYRMAGSITDITERKMTEEQLIFDALHDALTGLPNRVLFMDRLTHAVDREKRKSNELFAVIFLDMDRFKVLNDSLGHTAGDKLLVAISQRLKEGLRPGDTIARLGGDEFAILLEDLKDVKEAIQISERVLEKLRLTFDLDGQEIFATASLGIALSSKEYENPEYLLRDADIAMYQAKANGCNRYEVFDNSMYDNAVARLQLETDLRQAMNQEEFRLHYQPIISMKTGKITGVEGLIRWQHPLKGLINPDEFIPTAEETGLIVTIGEWVISEAAHQLSRWQKIFPFDPPLTVSVNISSKQLLPTLVKHIKDVLGKTGLDPGSLILEITESILMESAEMVAPLLLQLKGLGVKLYIDDFGTGYSSLSYLHGFPVDVLKIDRSFIARIGSNGDNLEIVKAIVTLAHSLDMKVIAEGVETEEQLEKLKKLGCEYIQGFFYSKPLEMKMFEDLLKQSGGDLLDYLKNKK